MWSTTSVVILLINPQMTKVGIVIASLPVRLVYRSQFDQLILRKSNKRKKLVVVSNNDFCHGDHEPMEYVIALSNSCNCDSSNSCTKSWSSITTSVTTDTSN